MSSVMKSVKRNSIALIAFGLCISQAFANQESAIQGHSSLDHAIQTVDLPLSGQGTANPYLNQLEQDIRIETAQIRGVAVNIDNGEVAYSELHHCNDGSTICRIQYQDAQGQLIIDKYLNYGVDASAPDFMQLDIRNGNFVGSERQGDKTVFFSAKAADSQPDVNRRANSQPKDVKQTIVDTKASLVIDAGFDNFIRQHWQRLTDGDSMNFAFALPSRGSAVSMSIKQLSHKKCTALLAVQAEGIEQAPAECFEIKPKSLLFSVFLKPIKIAYDSSSQKLLAFKGLTSIKDANNKAQTVLIRYEYL